MVVQASENVPALACEHRPAGRSPEQAPYTETGTGRDDRHGCPGHRRTATDFPQMLGGKVRQSCSNSFEIVDDPRPDQMKGGGDRFLIDRPDCIRKLAASALYRTGSGNERSLDTFQRPASSGESSDGICDIVMRTHFGRPDLAHVTAARDGEPRISATDIGKEDPFHGKFLTALQRSATPCSTSGTSGQEPSSRRALHGLRHPSPTRGDGNGRRRP